MRINHTDPLHGGEYTFTKMATESDSASFYAEGRSFREVRGEISVRASAFVSRPRSVNANNSKLRVA
jgi:hypothetical protein